MNIKQAAEQSGVSARNIRYYEQAGLLTPARNPENEYRIYSQADVRALKLIRMLRTLDMPVEEIGTVLNGTLPLAEAAERQRQRLERLHRPLRQEYCVPCSYPLSHNRVPFFCDGHWYHYYTRNCGFFLNILLKRHASFAAESSLSAVTGREEEHRRASSALQFS